MSLIRRMDPRPIKFTAGINPYAAGSVIAEFGNTKVHITASVEDGVPKFLTGREQGWITAEYSMLPGSTNTRTKREREKVSGRSSEIQRLIGRSMRSVVDLKKLGERTITVDCDVLVADGGTRTTSISGAFVAVSLAIKKLLAEGLIAENPIREQVGAISIGIDNDGKILADLNYAEDSTCETDMNIIMTKTGKFVEIQGTAEKEPFNRDQLNAILECAENALKHVFKAQDEVLK